MTSVAFPVIFPIAADEFFIVPMANRREDVELGAFDWQALEFDWCDQEVCRVRAPAGTGHARRTTGPTSPLR